MNKKPKQRLDLLLVSLGWVDNIQKAQSLIMAGKVRTGTQILDKPGQLIHRGAPLEIEFSSRFVSRGGVKLQFAFDSFPKEMVDCTDKICMDVGASTGGFTDCLLQNGAREIIAIDVGYGQFHYRLRDHPQVTLFEKTNFRTFPETHPREAVDLIVSDVSFISLATLLPPFLYFSNPFTRWIFLIKPQFEAEREKVERGGVIRDPSVHFEVIKKVATQFSKGRRILTGLKASPLLGPSGNREFLAVFLDLQEGGKFPPLSEIEIEREVFELTLKP